MKTMKKIISLLLAVVLVFGMMPAAMANTGNQIYISVSFDGQYIDGANGAAIAYIPVPIDAVASVDLDSYGLGEYWYDEDGDGVYEVTALQMVIYAHENIYGGDWSDVTFTGAPGSSYFQGGIFGFDENLNYYLNGEYPLAGAGWGATSDQIVLEAGDYLDVAGFSSWDFYMDSNYGFHFFADESGAFTHNYVAEEGSALPVKLVRSYSGMGSGAAVFEEADYNVYYGTSYGNAAGSVVTDGSGCAEIIFPYVGTWYLWCDGGYGMEYPDSIVSAPAYAKVQVLAETPEEPAEPAYAFTDSMTAALELESEVFMVISPVLTNADGSTLSAEDAAAAQENVGIIMWDAAAAPAEADATMENAGDATVVLGATYNAANGKMEVKTDGIAAKALGDNLTIRSFYTDGNGQYIYGKYVASYSPKKYCYNQITKGTATKDVCVALLNYGAAAQVYFDYNTDTLMNSELTAEQQAYNWDGSLVRSNWIVDAAKEGTLARQNPPINSRGGTLELEGAINVVFSGAAASISVAKAELLIWDEEAFAAADVLSEENAAQVVEMSLRADGKYEYIYEGVAAKEMFKTIYACQKYTDVDGNVYYGGVLPFCAERYGYNNQNKTDGLGELVQTMIIYGDAARTLFN